VQTFPAANQGNNSGGLPEKIAFLCASQRAPDNTTHPNFLGRADLSANLPLKVYTMVASTPGSARKTSCLREDRVLRSG
jgi:hypothetical protein